METAFYYSTANTIFLTPFDAQGYFNEIIYDRMNGYEELDDFLMEKGYSLTEIFTMGEEEKTDIISDYKDYLFKNWLDDECCEVDIYEDKM